MSVASVDAAPLFGFELAEEFVHRLNGFPDPLSLTDGSLGGRFVWVHLDLSNPDALTWMKRLALPDDIIAAVSEPVQRGRLFAAHDILYGQLRDLRIAPSEPGRARHGGALSILLGKNLVITGRVQPLTAVEDLRNRLASGRIPGIATPFSWLIAFFDSLNDIAEGELDKAYDRLGTLENRVLKMRSFGSRGDVVTMRREGLILVRDMAYKRTSLLGLFATDPPLSSESEVRELKRQIDRYSAQIEDLQDYADRCQFLLDEMRTQLDEATNRNLHILTVFSAVFMPATLIAGMWGMNVAWLPFGLGEGGFFELSALIFAAIGLTLGWLRWMRIF